jgi:2-keto-3-deoxy-L-rhamnonate aldolase RhmA
MALKLMYITNKESVAIIAEHSGVDWIFIDLEINGKEERQGNLDTVISRHHIDDVKKIKRVLTKAKLLVRVNPIYEGSKDEIDRVINDGANIVMLPFFKKKDEVEAFIDYVSGRAKTCLLCETAEAVENMDDILLVEGIDLIHIGLNDLHIAYKMDFLFEPLATNTVDMLCNKFRAKGIPYGFGGIAQLGQGAIPAENIIAEHYRLSSSMVILSRSFCNVSITNNLDEIKNIFCSGIKKLRDFESELESKSKTYFIINRKNLIKKIENIVLHECS